MLLDPTPANCRAVRERAGLTLAAIAELANLKAGQRWAEYEMGERRIDRARWELVLLKLGEHSTLKLSRRKPE